MHGGGEVGITAQEGEFMFQRSAVQRIGRGRLEAMNEGRDSGSGRGDTYVIQAVDPESFARYFDRYLRNGGHQKIRSVAAMMRMEGR